MLGATFEPGPEDAKAVQVYLEQLRGGGDKSVVYNRLHCKVQKEEIDRWIRAGHKIDEEIKQSAKVRARKATFAHRTKRSVWIAKKCVYYRYALHDYMP